ncbi:hypothetical protein Cs7R123_67580 [Catellatospora sp. TT07R-123]|uniref:hypothetical protein n=1 Tax=Catellatospora sp. TT07R-123 TaxID=2733863 RepID=UPI001B11B37F|nr:hypothetical protein [Catellatospora sp. TT07R-123]GHJ49416.1 hypothetical protein Cs7R123_67580 [Catellatospora sp. TT07R-123]
MRRWYRRDDGKVTVFFTIIATAWIVTIGLVVVGSGRTRALQRADNIAAEAARAAGQAIDPEDAIQGKPKVVDATLAAAAAQAYLRTVGATGSVTVAPDRQHLTVRATVSYDNPVGLDFFGGATWTATGEATATLLIG